MAIAKKYEDVVAERDAALAREAELRDELKAARLGRDYCNRVALHNKEVGDALQQRLTVAEKRVQRMVDCSKGKDSVATGYLSDILALLNPAAEAEIARDQGIPGTSFQRLNRLANEGE